MKRIFILLLVLVVIALLWYWFGRPKPDQCEFTGKVVDETEKPVVGALIELGEQTIETGERGEFKIPAACKGRYVLNVTKLGYGFVSKIYDAPTADIVITMTAATVVENLNPAEAIVITDTTPVAAEPITPDVTHLPSPLDTIPFVYDAAGNLIAFGAPAEIADTYEAIEEFEPQQTGATIEVEPDALEDPDGGATGSLLQGTKGRGDVTGSVSTVAIYSRDGMPGDYSTRMQNGERGFMVTYGAADINFYRNGKPLQLKKGKFATLTLPVDTLAIIYGQKLPEQMPLLVYDKKAGVWQRDGENMAVLNKERTAYVAKVSHFSVFNMDEEFTAGVAACIKLCSDAAPAGANIEITGDNPGHVKYLPFGTSICAGTGGCSVGETAYLINNLKPNTAIGVRLFDAANVIRSSYVFISGGPGNENNCAGNYAACVAVEDIAWGLACYQNTDAVGSLDGPILAINRVGDVFNFSWLYIDPAATGAPLTNPATTNYVVEFFTATNQTQPLDLTDAAWTDVLFGGSATVSDTNYKVNRTATIPGVSTTAPVFVRVKYRIGAGPFTSGVIYLLNPLTLTVGLQTEQDFSALTCFNAGTPVL